MATINIEPLHSDFGARINGLDVSAPLSDETVEDIGGRVQELSLIHI